MTRYIDADPLLEELKLSSNMHAENSREFSLLFRNIVIVNEQPTADVAPVRHGKWLPKHHYIAGHEFVSGHICSECGDDALNAEGDEFLTDYCPNCGAFMRGEE